MGVHWKDWCWSWNSNILATSCEELTHWKRLWCWEGLGARGEGDKREWDGCMASLSQWTWFSVNSGSWWWTRRPVCCFSCGHKESDTTERLNWTEWKWCNSSWTISNPKRWCYESAALNMTVNLENSAVATGLEKVSFHSNSKERQCQRTLKLPHNCTHLTR